MQYTIKSRSRINRIVKLTNHSVLCYEKNSLKVLTRFCILIVSGRLLNSFDALSWKVQFLVGTTNLIELLERSSLRHSCFIISR